MIPPDSKSPIPEPRARWHGAVLPCHTAEGTASFAPAPSHRALQGAQEGEAASPSQPSLPLASPGSGYPCGCLRLSPRLPRSPPHLRPRHPAPPAWHLRPPGTPGPQAAPTPARGCGFQLFLNKGAINCCLLWSSAEDNSHQPPAAWGWSGQQGHAPGEVLKLHPDAPEGQEGLVMGTAGFGVGTEGFGDW